MTASPLAPANGFVISGWLLARLAAAHTPATHSNRLWRVVLAMRLHWLHRGIVLPLCETKDYP
jgi:hypothetical protein